MLESAVAWSSEVVCVLNPRWQMAREEIATNFGARIFVIPLSNFREIKKIWRCKSTRASGSVTGPRMSSIS